MNPEFLQTLLENQPDYDAAPILYEQGHSSWPGVGRYIPLPLPEGLIKSESIHALIYYLTVWHRLGYKVRNGDALQVYGIAPIKWDVISQTINRFGWLIAHTTIPGYEGKYSDNKTNIDNFLKLGKGDFSLYLEAKYAPEMYDPPRKLYHASPAKHREKILRIGLVPKSGGKKSDHPPRIYLTLSLQDCEQMATELESHDGLLRDIYEINLPADLVKMFIDPMDTGKGSVYTYTNIPPAWLKLVKHSFCLVETCKDNIGIAMTNFSDEFIRCVLDNQPDYNAPKVIYEKGRWPGGIAWPHPVHEGLLYSTVADNVQGYISMNFGLVSRVYPKDDDRFGGMIAVKGKLPIKWSVIAPIINNFGWYPCYLTVSGKYDGSYPFNPTDDTQRNLKKELDGLLEYSQVNHDFTAYFEAKYAKQYFPEHPVYHASPVKINKATKENDARISIAKIGLTPATGNKLASHYPRVYFSDTEEDCEAMAKKLSIKSGCTEYDIYEVNIPYGTMSLYRDPADEANRSAYAISNVPTEWVKLVKTIT